MYNFLIMLDKLEQSTHTHTHTSVSKKKPMKFEILLIF